MKKILSMSFFILNSLVLEFSEKIVSCYGKTIDQIGPQICTTRKSQDSPGNF